MTYEKDYRFSIFYKNLVDKSICSLDIIYEKI